MITADMDEKASHGATMNGHGANGADGKDQETLPTVSPGRLHYSKDAQRAAFVECRAAVAK